MLAPGRKTAVGGAVGGTLLQRAKQRAAGATPPKGLCLAVTRNLNTCSKANG